MTLSLNLTFKKYALMHCFDAQINKKTAFFYVEHSKYILLAYIQKTSRNIYFSAHKLGLDIVISKI